jgi:predicted amidohydrolase YtcJ
VTTLYSNARWWRDGTPVNLLVDGNRVAYRGSDTPAADRVADLMGQTLMPGFFDCHCHVLNVGIDLLRLNLEGCESREDVEVRVRECASSADSDWLLAVHYDANRFADGKDVTAGELSGWTAGRPAILRQVSGHSCIANEEALRIANVGSSTPDPRGGHIVRDASGAPTGLLEETAMSLVYDAVPKLTRAEMAEAICRAGMRMNAFGITAASDMNVGYYDFEDEIAAYRSAAERGCPVRFSLYVAWRALMALESADELPSDDRVAFRGAKLFADGAIGAGTAAIHGEYETGGNGMLLYPPEELKRRVVEVDARGFQVAVHSIGDRCTDHVLDAFDATGTPQRHRLEHGMLLSDEQIGRIARLRVPVVMQPEFLAHFGGAYRRRLGDERASQLKRIRSLRNAGVTVALSSDQPIVAGNPWTGISAAANRPTGFNPSENISREEATAMYTECGAGIEGWSYGSLSPGQLADFQIYDPSEELGSLPPAEVRFAG